ncbi:TPR repeat region-containing protein [Nocardiopsis sp. NPDC055551]
MTSTPEPSVPLLPSAPSPLTPPAERIPEFDPPDTKVRTDSLKERCDDAWKLTGRVMGDAGTGRAAITRSAKEFSDLIDGDISSAGAFNEKEWRKACLALTYAASIADRWREDVEEFRRERKKLIDRYSTAIVMAGLANEGNPMYRGTGPLQSPPTYGPHVPSPRQLAYYEVHREYMAKGRKLKDGLEETAAERATLLKEGPEPSNLKVLVEAGVLGWGAYNILGAERDVPLPVSSKEAKEMAREMKSYLDGDKEPDARFHEIIAALGAVSAKAKKLQEAGRSTLGQPYRATMHRPTLGEEELDFLETFYGEMEDQTPNGVVRLVPWLEGHDGPDWSDAERKTFTGAMADGLLVLSDEKVGGGQYLLPESVQNLANGIPSPNDDVRTGRHMNDPSGNWLADARDFGLLMAASDPDMRGGTEFSANTTLSMGHHLANKDLDLHESYDKGLSAVLDVTTRNEEADHRILTDAHDHPMTRSAHERAARIPGMPDFENNADALLGLYSYNWHDEGEAVAGLTDWIPDFKEGTTAEARMAGEATVGLITTLAGSEDDRPFHDTDAKSDSAYQEAVTEINPELTKGLTRIYLAYQDDFVVGGKSDEYGAVTGAEGSHLLHDLGDSAVLLKDETKQGFLQLLIADDSNAPIITASAEEMERRVINAAVGDPADTAAGVAGARVGRLRTLLHEAMITEYEDRYDDKEEAKQQAADNWQTAFNIGVALNNGVLGSVPGPGSALAFGGETILRLLESPQKEAYLERWDAANSGDEDDKKSIADVVDTGEKAYQHAQLQLLQVYLDRGAITPEALQDRGLLPEGHDAAKDPVYPAVVKILEDDDAGTFPILDEALEDAGEKSEVNGGHEDWVEKYQSAVERYYKASPYMVKDEQ